MEIEEIETVLRDALDMLETHPPIEVREYGRPHGGEHDCHRCAYPLTGTRHPDLPKHEDHKGATWSRCPGQPCDYMVLMKRLRQTIAALQNPDDVPTADIVTRIGNICTGCGGERAG